MKQYIESENKLKIPIMSQTNASINVKLIESLAQIILSI